MKPWFVGSSLSQLLITDQELASADKRQPLPDLIHLIYIAHLEKKRKYLNKTIKMWK